MHGYKWPINCTRTRTALERELEAARELARTQQGAWAEERRAFTTELERRRAEWGEQHTQLQAMVTNA